MWVGFRPVFESNFDYKIITLGPVRVLGNTGTVGLMTSAKALFKKEVNYLQF